jgi:predicted nucleic acid-binding protein
MILVDTNIFIEYYKNNSTICEIMGRIDPQKITVSDVVCAELYFGARNKHELENIVTDFEIV